MTYLSGDIERAADLADIYHHRWIQSRPVCVKCGEHIQDEVAYDIDGDIYCPQCIREMRFFVEDREVG